MHKLVFLLLSWICFAHALEIPVEEDLSISSLSNGVQVWLKEHGYPNRSLSCRIIARNSLEEAPQIFSLDCPTEIFEEELPYFIDYCRESIQKQAQCDIAVVVVGDFDASRLGGFLAEAFDVFTRHQPPASSLVEVTSSSQSDVVYLSLYYPTVLQTLKTAHDLKQLWILYLFQSMCQDRFHKALSQVSGEWISPTETRYFLPLLHTAVHGKQCSKEKPVTMLNACLEAMHELKGKGFIEAELFNAKAKLQKNLTTFYQQNPDSNTLADYFASHFALGMGSPQYDTFMQVSLNLISDITMQDMTLFLGNYFKDATRRVGMVVPKELVSETEKEVQKALENFKTDELVFDFNPNVDQKEPFSQLTVTDQEKQLIYEIFDTIAKNSVPQLIFKASDMEKKGRKINHVHPLRLLGTIFSNPHLKKCMNDIADNFFKWNGFINGLFQRLDEEYVRDNLVQHIPGFCQTIKANPDQVSQYIQKKEWEKLVRYIIKLT